MNQLLAICDRETILVKTLSAYLKTAFIFPIMAFDDADRFLAFEKEREEEDICLIGEDFLDAFQTEQLLTKVRRPLYLTEAKNGSGIYKYQSIHEMAKAILKLCEEEALLPVKGTATTETKLIAFYSPAHHMLQSSIALTMGQILAKNKKVLYLNFEPYSGFEYIMQKKFVYDMMDILYFLQEDAEKFRCRLESMVEMTGNLYYLPPVFSYPDMEEIDEKTWQAFLRKIIRETDYEVIILDLTEQVRGLFSLLELCDEIYSCIPKDGLAMAKMEQYKKLLSHIKKEDLLSKTKECKIPVFKEFSYQAALYTHTELADYVQKLMEKKRKKMNELKQEIKSRLLEKLDHSMEMEDEAVQELVENEVWLMGKETYIPLAEKKRLCREIYYAIRKYDVLQELLEDETVTEIMVNGPDHIFIEKEGRLQQWQTAFESEDKLLDVIQQIVAKANRVVNESSPIVDARLFGSRVHVVLPPVALNGPILTIRRFGKTPLLIPELLRLGSVSQEICTFWKSLSLRAITFLSVAEQAAERRPF